MRNLFGSWKVSLYGWSLKKECAGEVPRGVPETLGCPFKTPTLHRLCLAGRIRANIARSTPSQIRWSRPSRPSGRHNCHTVQSSLSSSVLSLLQSTRTVLQKAHNGHAAVVDVVLTGKFQVPFYSNTVIVQKL